MKLSCKMCGGKTNLRLCRSCKTCYCSVECQRKDWAGGHRKFCLGKYFLPGPQLFVPYPQMCHNCCVWVKTVSVCPLCYQVWYCGSLCQLDHWPEHAGGCTFGWYAIGAGARSMFCFPLPANRKVGTVGHRQSTVDARVSKSSTSPTVPGTRAVTGSSNKTFC